jgi:hypothetical protein
MTRAVCKQLRTTPKRTVVARMTTASGTEAARNLTATVTTPSSTSLPRSYFCSRFGFGVLVPIVAVIVPLVVNDATLLNVSLVAHSLYFQLSLSRGLHTHTHTRASAHAHCLYTYNVCRIPRIRQSPFLVKTMCVRQCG